MTDATNSGPSKPSTKVTAQAKRRRFICGRTNVDLLRPAAQLEVLIVARQDDSSPGSVDLYRDILKTVKRGLGAIRVLAWTGPDDGGSGPTGGAADGARLRQIAQQTGGTIPNVCVHGWSSTLPGSSQSWALLPRRYPLSRPAKPASIQVTLDGAVRYQLDVRSGRQRRVGGQS